MAKAEIEVNGHKLEGEVIPVDEIELSDTVLGLIVDVCAQSPTINLLGQRIAGLLEGHGMAPDTPVRLVVTSAKLIMMPRTEAAE